MHGTGLLHANTADLLPHCCRLPCRRGAEVGQAAQRCVAQCVAVLVVKQGAGQVQSTVQELLAMLKSDEGKLLIMLPAWHV